MKDLDEKREKCRKHRSQSSPDSRRRHHHRKSISRSRSRSRSPKHHTESRCKKKRHVNRARADKDSKRYREERLKVKEEPPSEDERAGKRENIPSNAGIKEESRESAARVPRSRWEHDESTEDRDARLGRTRNNRGNKVNNENRKGEDFKWGKEGDEGEKKKPIENKAKPDFGLSGKLAEEVNTYKGVVIKYSEPPEARIPKTRWRLYPFKGEENLPTMYIHRQSGYLIGRERKIADIPVDHPSCSKQHAVLQYRLVPYTRGNGTKGQRVRPYIIDLESANGTYVNNKKIEPKRYVELLERDVLKFAYSSREYVLLHEHSKDDILDDDPVE